MRKEVPLALQEAHLKHIKESVASGVDVAKENFLLDNTQIAGTEKSATTPTADSKPEQTGS